MQFIKNGPDIPDRLLQAHEDGKVAFFCGAGISYPAKLPGFEGLVNEIYSKLGENKDPLEKAAFERQQYDTVIGLLEKRIVGGRDTVRGYLPSILTPDLSVPSATKTHEALLTLAKNRKGALRLVTTNFDHLFHEVIKEKDLSVPTFEAPLLPIPKKHQWDGLVYLHGLLPDDQRRDKLDQLVLSSGDFGLAYLLEAWAARFVGELFRNFTVCFVGYSINDPVLRYMTDALAADKQRGESQTDMFAFGSCSEGKESEQENEWKAKNVTPILYREDNSHSYFHETIRDWSDKYRDGVQGKELIVAGLAVDKPVSSTSRDDVIGRMLWALSDPSGRPARRFAEMNPVPSIDWLTPFSQRIYKHSDLNLFGIVPKDNGDDEPSFGLLCRPTPYWLAPEMTLAKPASDENLDKVMFHLANWLTRHLNDPKLALWIADQGGNLHSKFRSIISRRIDRLNELAQGENCQELDEIRRNAPNAIPSPFMKVLWRLILNGRLISKDNGSDLYFWKRRFKRDGLTLALRTELREILTSRIKIRRRMPSHVDDEEAGDPRIMDPLVHWEIDLNANHLLVMLSEWREDEKWKNALPKLLPDFDLLLHDALDLSRELSGVEYREVETYFEQPSISHHYQNGHYSDWTVLIELLREAWIFMVRQDPRQAQLVAEGWMRQPYPMFRRMAFFAATVEDVVPANLALSWLLDDGNQWLWSIETRRETIRLLVSLATSLDDNGMSELESAVLRGPQRDLHVGNVSGDLWTEKVDRDIWLRLAKMAEAGAKLGDEGKRKLDELTRKYPDWRLAVNQRDEFASWSGPSEEEPEFSLPPQEKDELTQWLKRDPKENQWLVSDWQELCRKDFSTVASTLIELAEEDFLPEVFWKIALLTWTEEENLERSWNHLAKFFVEALDEFFQAIAHEFIIWLMDQAEKFEGQNDLFFRLIGRVLELEHQSSEKYGNDLVARAYNDPVGRVTEAVMRWWYRHTLQDGEGLPDEIKLLLIELCDAEEGKYICGRVILAINLVSLYRVDQRWTAEHLLPLFDWENYKTEAPALWQGFLFSPRLHWPLLEDLKIPLLDAAGHFAELGPRGENYATLLTFMALDLGETFTTSELATAIRSLPLEGLNYVAVSLVRALSGAGDQRGEYWKNRVLPFLDEIWPNSIDVVSPEILKEFARLCIAAGDAFPEATERLKGWLQHPVVDSSRTRRANVVIREIHEAELSKRFPDAALMLLDSLGLQDNDAWLISDQLADCLDDIRDGKLALEKDPRFQNLQNLRRDQ